MVTEIYKRRSIRKYQDKPISRQDILDIIESGTKAPSSKNRQPWKFIAVQGEEKEEMLNAFRAGISREETGDARLPGSREYIAGAKYTVKILEQTPVVIFVVNPLGKGLFRAQTTEERIYDICNIQSVGAAIQNMLLRAVELGLGALWIANTCFAYTELTAFLGTPHQLTGVVAIGYPDEEPSPRPRKPFDEVVEYRLD